MSNSFRDAVRNVMEGAKEKTLDGMTPDAKRFRHDLHPIKDPGVKLMVQKDSETKDYEKMFKPDTAKAKERLADMSSDKALDKYVEYNEAVRMEEKKHMKGCTCESCMAKEEKEDEKAEAKSDKKIAEASVMPASAGKAIAARVNTQRADAKQTSAISAREPAAPAAKPFGGIGAMGGAGTAAAVAAKGKTSIATGGANSVKPSGGSAAGMAARMGDNPGAPSTGMKAQATNMAAGKAAERSTPAAAPTKFGGKGGAFDQARKAGLKSFEFGGKKFNTGIKGETQAQTAGALAKNKAASAAGASVTSGPKAGAGAGPGRAPSPAAAAPKAAQPTRPGQATSGLKPGAGAGPGRAPTGAPKVAPNPQASQAKGMAAQRGPTSQQGMSMSSFGAKYGAAKGTVGARSQLTQSYEIEINGQSYMMSETHAAAIAAYVEKYGITEKSDPAVGEFISKEMKHPEKLTAQGKKQKIKQAIAIYYSKKRHGEKP